MITEMISLKGGVHFFLMHFVPYSFEGYLKVVCILNETDRVCLYCPGLQCMIVLVLWPISAVSATLAFNSQMIVLLL